MFCTWLFFAIQKGSCFSSRKSSHIIGRWEKSPFGTIFPNDRSASPTAGKPSLLSHDVLPTVAFDAFRKGVKNSFRNDDKAERSLANSLKNQYETRRKIRQNINVFIYRIRKGKSKILKKIKIKWRILKAF